MRDHGTRSRYIHDKCRCDECRRANADYARRKYRAEHRPDDEWEPFISADDVHRHLTALRAAGVGTRSIAARTGLGRSTINNILNGSVTRIRRETADRVLGTGTTAIANGALVDADRTWHLIGRMRKLRHLTDADIARLLGYKTPALQLGKRKITAGRARAVEALARRLGVI